MSGFIALSFVSHHLSPSFVSDHMSALVAVSCSSFIMISFVLRVCLCSLLPLCLLVASRKNHASPYFSLRFTTGLPLVSYLLPFIVSDTNGVATNRNHVASENVACDSCCSQMTWINNDQQLPAPGASITMYNHKHAHRRCKSLQWVF